MDVFNVLNAPGEDNAFPAAAPADNVIRAPQYDVDAKESLKITSVWEEVAVQVSLLSPSFSPLSRTACGPHLGKTISPGRSSDTDKTKRTYKTIHFTFVTNVNMLIFV